MYLHQKTLEPLYIQWIYYIRTGYSYISADIQHRNKERDIHLYSFSRCILQCILQNNVQYTNIGASL